LARLFILQLSQEEMNKEFKSYVGRERVVLRKRRIKLRVDQFRIIAQVSFEPIVCRHLAVLAFLTRLVRHCWYRSAKEATDPSSSPARPIRVKSAL
jgi:hypothetical protein